MYCKNCGSEIKDGFSDCEKCEANAAPEERAIANDDGVVEAVNEPAVSPDESVGATMDNQHENDVVDGFESANFSGNDNVPEVHKTNKLIWIISGVGAALVVSLVWFLVIALWGSPKTDATNYFKMGLCPVKVVDNWGFVDQKGQMAINPQFEGVSYFAENGLAVAKTGAKCGYIDKSGKFVINPQYDYAISFDKGDLAPVKIGEKWGFVDKTGAMIISPQFEQTSAFTNGYAIIILDKKRGIIDTTGKFVIAPQYEALWCDESMTIFSVEKDEKAGVLDAAGNTVVPLQYEYITEFSENGLALIKDKGKYGYINKSGAFVISAQFDNAGQFMKNGLAPVAVDEKWGFIDRSGKYVINPQYDAIDDRALNDGPVAVRLNGKWGFVDTTGKLAIPMLFDDARSFRGSELAPVLQDKKWGFVDKNGNMVVVPQYISVADFDSNGLAPVRDTNKKISFVNTKGDIVISSQFDAISDLTVLIDIPYCIVDGCLERVSDGEYCEMHKPKPVLEKPLMIDGEFLVSPENFRTQFNSQLDYEYNKVGSMVTSGAAGENKYYIGSVSSNIKVSVMQKPESAFMGAAFVSCSDVNYKQQFEYYSSVLMKWCDPLLSDFDIKTLFTSLKMGNYSGSVEEMISNNNITYFFSVKAGQITLMAMPASQY